MDNVNGSNISDELTKRIVSYQEETSDFLQALLSLLGMKYYLNSKNITLHVKRLSDGIDESDYNFEKRFIYGDINTLSKTLSFEKMPISENIETYKDPLMLISDENEIDEYIKQRIIKRKEHKLDTFPVLIFCDDFFTVREGESFGYLNIIESIQQVCGDNCYAMAFKMSDMKKDNKYVKAYINYLDMILHLREAKECVVGAFEYIDGVIDTLNVVVKNTNYTDIKRLAAIAKIKNYLKFRDNLIKKYNGLDKLIKKVDGLILIIRNQYDKHIDCIRKKEPLKRASSMAVHIDLKYGTFKDQLLAFLTKVKESSLFTNNDFLPRDTVSLVEESYKEINTNTSELTLIGTFSSGKTTMINTFLGHAHKLHTSKNHNTAVLMQIKKKPDNEQYEFYEVINKEKLIWSLIKPAYLETKLYRNPFPDRAKVISIRQNEQGYVVKLKEISGEKKIKDIHIAKMHKLCISEKDVVDGGASLIMTDISENELQLASKNELQLLMEYISKKKLIHPKVKVSCKNGEREYKDKDAIRFLDKLGKCEKYNQISKANRHPLVYAESLSELMGEEIVFATFFSNILENGKKVKLDEDGWKDFGGSDKQDPFCEAPECYM